MHSACVEAGHALHTRAVFNGQYMKALATLLMCSILVSCNPKKKVCQFTSTHEELVIYNNILTDLIENHMHGKYLGGREEEIQ